MKKLFWVSIVVLIMISCSSLDVETLQVDYYNLARDFHSLGKLDRSEVYYNLALDLPDPPLEIYYNLSLLYMQQGRFNEADRKLNQLEKIDPENRELLRLRLYLEMQQENWDRAEQIIIQLLDLYPDDPYALEYSGRINKDKELWDEAAADLSRIKENEWTESAFDLYISVLEHLEDEFSLKDFLDDNRESEWLTQNLAEKLLSFYKQDEQYQIALNWLDKMLQLFPEKKEAYQFSKAELLLSELNQWDEGLKELQAALKGGYNNSQELKNLQEALGEGISGEVEALIALYQSE